MNMQDWPGHNFCRSARVNTVYYVPADWVWVALHPFGNFCAFSVGNFDQKLLKKCAVHATLRGSCISGVEPPFSPGIFICQARQVLGDDYKVFIVEEMDDLVLTV